MANFLFSPADTVNLSTGVFYAHIVSSVPSISAISVSQITITDATNYVPYILTGLVFNTVKWTFNNFTLPAYLYNTIPVGVVVCKQLGGSPANTDPILYYTDFTNALNQAVTLNTGKYILSITFPFDGIIRFKDSYSYTSAAYANTQTYPFGLMYLLSTRNNTQGLFDPANTAISYSNLGANFFNRSAGTAVNTSKFFINYYSRRIKVGVMAFWCVGTSSSNIADTVQLYGSNTYVTGSSLDIAADWTLLGSSGRHVVGINFLTSNNNSYWRVLKIVGPTSNFSVDEIEFYNSTMLSSHPNLMSVAIDSPFTSNIIDNADNGTTWQTSLGNPIIQDNALYLAGNSSVMTASAFPYDISIRNFEFSLDYKAFTASTNATITSILNFDGADLPFNLGTQNNQYYLQIGTSSAAFYTPTVNSTYIPGYAGVAGSAGLIGVPSFTSYDRIKVTRYNNVFTTTVTINGATNTFTLFNTGQVGFPSQITLGVNTSARFSNGFIRNLKLVH